MTLLKSRVRGIVFIVLGLALVVLSGGMLFSYEQEETRAGENASILLADVRREIASLAADVTQNAAKTQAVGEMPSMMVDGYAAIGVLSIESVGIDLPILGEWSYDLLQVAPCRYSGTVSDGNLILLGHSYRDHFESLAKVQLGDIVEFLDTRGNVHKYEVALTEVLGANQLDELTNSRYDLTLFTCTFTGESRHVVRCERIG